MSVVLLIRSLGFGGAERQAIEIAKGLRARGMSVLVVVFYAGGALLEELTAANIPVQCLGKQSRWDVIGFLGRLINVVKRAKPHVIYSFLVVPGIIAVLLKLRFPKARVVWGILASEVDLTKYDWFARVTFRLSCWLSRFTDLILVNSEIGARYHEANGFPAARTVILPSGVDVDRFRPNPQAGLAFREKWHIQPDDKVVGVVGRLDPMKDHQTLFQAIAMLRNAGLSPKVVCAGEGQPRYAEHLRQVVTDHAIQEQVIWVGTQRDMVPVYNSLDILCLPSAFGEGWSNAIGEAMSCGVPCVATDVGDARRILANLGIVVPVRNAERLAEGIKSLLSAPKNGNPYRRRIVEHFSRDRMIHETVKLLLSTVDA